MLGIIAITLVMLWLLGLFAFHVSTGLIHIVLVVGLITLAVHLREKSRRSRVRHLADRLP
jgi:Family of unknown function (DUF5670)